jgi:hypothetical protein
MKEDNQNDSNKVYCPYPKCIGHLKKSKNPKMIKLNDTLMEKFRFLHPNIISDEKFHDNCYKSKQINIFSQYFEIIFV